MTAASLRKLPLEALLGQSESDGAGLDGSSPAYLTRETLQLCFTTRKQLYRLKELELVLLRACSKQEPRPSILCGALVRFVSKQEYRMSFISDTREEPAGQLMLLPQGFDRWVPSSCLSNTCTLSDDKQWAERGRDEVCALLRTLAGDMPSRREIASTCCRLSTGWLWLCQPKVFQTAVAANPAAVARQLEDPAAVTALLPCVEEPTLHSSRPPTPAAAAAAAARAAAAFRQKAQQGGSSGAAEGSGVTRAQTGTAAGNDAAGAGTVPHQQVQQQQPSQQQAQQGSEQHRLPALPPWLTGTQPLVAPQRKQQQQQPTPMPQQQQQQQQPSPPQQQQQQQPPLPQQQPQPEQQQQQQQQQHGPSSKRQRTDGSPTGRVTEGLRLPPQQQPGQPLLRSFPQMPMAKFSFASIPQGGQQPPQPLLQQSPVQPPPPHLPPPAQPVQSALQGPIVGLQVQQPEQQAQEQQAEKQQAQEQQAQEQQLPSASPPPPLLAGRVQAPLLPVPKQPAEPGYAWMPAGGPLERALMQGVHALTGSDPSAPCQLGDLGSQLLNLNTNYKSLAGKSHTLTQCAHELHHRGLIFLYSQKVQKARKDYYSYYFSALPAQQPQP